MTLDPEKVWAGVGLLGQGVFTARFVVQWLSSERQRDAVIPEAFWWLSLCGGLVTLTYAIHLQSLAFMLGQGMGLFVYVRNLMLVAGRKKRVRKQERRAALARLRADTAATS
jgi:lipid-A-disaccharide synthase-like uncharacterized protein